MGDGLIRWTEPSRGECLAVASLLPAAIATLETALVPADDMAKSRCLATLAVCAAPRAERGETAETWAFRAEEYKRLLGRFPADIWQTVCDEWVTSHGPTGRWYPTSSELFGLMSRMTAQRERRLARLKRMADIARSAADDEKSGRFDGLTPEQKAAAQRHLKTIRTRFPSNRHRGSGQ